MITQNMYVRKCIQALDFSYDRDNVFILFLTNK